MAIWTDELNTSFNFPNLNIFNKLKDGVLIRYEVRPYEGYVMYRTTDNYTEPLVDENGNQVYDEDGNPVEVPVIYYYTVASLPLTYNFNNFNWIAVPRDSVDENYIFGGGNNNDHEIM